MNTFLKAFKYASIISLFLTLVKKLVALLVADPLYTSPDYIGLFFEAIPIFIPCFFSIYFYRQKILSSIKNIIIFLAKSIVISSAFTYIFDSLHSFDFYSQAPSKLYFLSLRTIISNIIIIIFSTLIYYLVAEKSLLNKETKKVVFPIKNVILIYVVISLLYMFFIYRENITNQYLLIILLGLLASLSIYIIINYCKGQHLNKNTKITLYTITYLFNIILIPILFRYLVSFLYPLEGPKGGVLEIIHAFTIGINLMIIIQYYLTITVAIHFYYIYLVNKQEKEKLKQIGVTASLKYQQLKAQLSPHFLFNNISVLTGLIEEDQTKAIHFSENLSNIYRYFLDQEKQDIVTLKEEMIFARKYLDLLKVRYENALTVNNIVINSEDYYILPMALQQVFENVIKHNEISIEQHLTIDISNDKEYLTITNTINPKINPQASSQTGLENIINRYSFFTDKKVIVTKDTTNYTIKLPLLKIEA